MGCCIEIQKNGIKKNQRPRFKNDFGSGFTCHESGCEGAKNVVSGGNKKHLSANFHYGHGMSESLSNAVLKIQSTISIEKLLSTKHSTEIGYALENDIQYTGYYGKSLFESFISPRELKKPTSEITDYCFFEKHKS